jgi:hypothetical protein
MDMDSWKRIREIQGALASTGFNTRSNAIRLSIRLCHALLFDNGDATRQIQDIRRLLRATERANRHKKKASASAQRLF